MPEIRTAVRTGDTLAHRAARCCSRPPHILVTTPESLYILLTPRRAAQFARRADGHRGRNSRRCRRQAWRPPVLSLERLEALTSKPPVRIGLSATQKPIGRNRAFPHRRLTPAPADCRRWPSSQMDLAIEVPAARWAPSPPTSMWDEIYDRLADLVATTSLNLGVRQYATVGRTMSLTSGRTLRR